MYTVYFLHRRYQLHLSEEQWSAVYHHQHPKVVSMCVISICSAIDHSHAPLPHPGSVVPGYQQFWKCDAYGGGKRHAFVDGGAWFNQYDKAIHLPTCGYYYVYSQVLFAVSEPNTTTVFHNLNIEQNCSNDAVTYMMQGKAAIGPHDPHNPRARNQATTFVSGVVKICKGGKVWITIPDTSNPCCPYGKSASTFMGAVLVSKSSCEWPPEETLSMH